MKNIINELHSIEPDIDIGLARDRVNSGLMSPDNSLVAILGPCAPETKGLQQLNDEGHDLALVGRVLNGLVMVHGLPIWKPRSPKPRAWHGEETTNPAGAMSIISNASEEFANAALEIGLPEHIARYANKLTFAWFGARNVNNIDLMLNTVSFDQGLPLAVKNGLDGNIEIALGQVERMKKERNADSAEVVLIYRGGNNAQTPEQWEEQYLQALAATNGKLIVDVAHGSEMAHDPNLEFKKSVLGQIACIDHVIELAEEGHVPAGIKVESSNLPSLVDPVIPFQTAVDAILRLRLAIKSS